MSDTNLAAAGGFIHVGGLTAEAASRGGVAAETRRIIERAQSALEASGSSLAQVAAVMVYLRSAADFAAMNEVYKTFWPKDPPTRTTVVVELTAPAALVEMSMIAAPAGAERRVVHPPGWMLSPNPYSYAIRSGDTLFLSGLVSRNGRDNSVVTGDVAAQTRAVMDIAGEILGAAGMTHANIVSARVYLPDAASFEQMNGAYRGYFKTAPPARATVQTGLASNQYSVEITFVASSAPRDVIDDGRPPNPNLSTGIRSGRRIHLSGTLGNTPATRGDAAAQTRETLARLRSALTAAGASPADVIESLIYVTDIGFVADVEREYRAFFAGHAHALTTVRSGLMADDGLVEIVMTAVK
jgi:enamine deaminase RidA (YjgF/YER057c/UK114 family)